MPKLASLGDSQHAERRIFPVKQQHTRPNYPVQYTDNLQDCLRAT